MKRREARQFLLRALYQTEFVSASLTDILEEVDVGDQRSYIESEYQDIIERKEEIDEILAPRTEGWRFDRLAPIDRNILRLGVFELLHAPDIPPEVVIDEAVELCKNFGTDRSAEFVNGILDRIWKETKQEI